MTNNIKAEDLKHNDKIIDPEGEPCTVIRLRRIDHQRGKLETNRGVAIVPLDQLFALQA